jgi:hypothetical protein
MRPTSSTPRLCIPIALSLGLLLLFASGNRPLAAERFTNASLNGNYAVFNIGRGGDSPQAGVSVARYDGKGTFSGVTIQDVPGPSFGVRVFVRASFTGNYTINPDARGTGTITTTLPDGSKEEVNTALVITKTTKANEAEVAEEFSFMHEQLGSRTGGLMTLNATRLPDGGKFTNGTLKGNYAYTLIGEGGPLPQSGLGVMTYDGVGSFSGTATVNIPGTSLRERRFVTAPFVRPYAVNPDGTGTATPPGESDIVFVVTRADVIGDTKLAEEVFFIVRELNPATGSLLTGMIKRLPN